MRTATHPARRLESAQNPRTNAAAHPLLHNRDVTLDARDTTPDRHRPRGTQPYSDPNTGRQSNENGLPCLITAGQQASPPHARGSTLCNGHARVQDILAPACAGINPLVDACSRCVGSHPRMRGDQPWWVLAEQPATSSPPHARGSTGRQSPPSPDDSPASARTGINPPPRCPGPGPPPRPRTHGDQPVCVVEVGPAQAPPPHGDQPGGWQISFLVEDPPPHARGSILVRDHRNPGGVPPPARTGINPDGLRGEMELRYPPPHADQPCNRLKSVFGVVSPPHTGINPPDRSR